MEPSFVVQTGRRYGTASTPETAPVYREAVSVETAARLLDCSEKTIRRLIIAGTLRAFRVGRLIRIRRDVLKAYSESR